MIHRFSSPDPYDANGVGHEGFVGFRSDVEREHPLIQQHDSKSADIRVAMTMATEVCNVSGADIDVYSRTDNEPDDIGKTFDEDPDPTYWSPITIKAFFAPGAIEVAMKSWGPEAEIKLEMYFSMQDLVRKFGKRVLRLGDVLYVPFNAIGNITPRYFRILNVTPIGNYKYVWMYMKVNCASLTGDIHVQPRDREGIILGE